ncbi:protein of unknown function [Octadecabacter temperatus]|uniref:Uncharacterized protein n=1 Tax=Octadecabacter temperatus TaxID=1458307 RepID=A0A0K0Y7C8_9RHOB|nr:DUF4174 domain-containing protein [Octadecabacter temperatus]AKS46762.1 hypothetical protein OSB_22250 [Octadecabacter temperatus]SIO20745.1 protein of unknown function [Octadecabacter temperatus]
MIRILALFAWVLAASVVTAQEVETPSIADAWAADKTQVFDATSLDIDTLIWLARPVVVFADSPNDPRFREQMDLLFENADDLAERDVIVLTDTDPSAQSPLRTRLRPRGFGLVIIGKDGEVELRKPSPWGVREITRSIDKMPLRQQEVDDRRFGR